MAPYLLASSSVVLKDVQMRQDRSIDHGGSNAQIASMRKFALEALSASSSVFYWIDESMEMADWELTGSCRRSFPQYRHYMKDYDPLNIPRLVKSGKRVSILHDDYGLAPRAEYDRYRCYLRDSAIVDVLDFVFWDGDRPFAGLGIIKNPGDPPFSENVPALARSMQGYLEFNLASHPRLQRERMVGRLTARYGLTRREIEIAELVCQGLTNHDLVEELGIGLGTVKTHLMKIFTKLEIENRASLSVRLARVGAETEAPVHWQSVNRRRTLPPIGVRPLGRTG
jgi:DNA-binding CsgD family transcriptional regulator